MKRIIYLHIGPHKTGTKNIQLNLVENKQALFDKGYLYPQSGSVFNGHHNIVFDVLNHKYFDSTLGNLKDLKKEISNETKNIILSSENFDLVSDITPLQKIKKAFEDKFDFKIIAYLRRQDYLICSYWKTELHMGFVHHAFNNYVNLSIKEKQFLFYDQWLGFFEKVFGRNNIEVILYENRLENHFKMFLDRCDISDTKAFDIKAESHVSWSDFTAFVYQKILKRISLVTENKTNEKSLNDWIGEELERRSIIAKEVEKYLLTQKLDKTIYLYNQTNYDKVLNTFKVSNQIVAREYFNTENLFTNWSHKEIIDSKPLADFPKLHLNKIYQSALNIIRTKTN